MLPALRTQRALLERRVREAPPSQARAFLDALAGSDVAVIAEVKRQSPSAGMISPRLDAVRYAHTCVAAGARAVSVVTEGPHFGGSLADLEAVARAVPTPALRKDFILDRVQLLEARAAGAAAVLLILRVLAAGEVRVLNLTAQELGLATLVEVHDRVELEAALELTPGVGAVGINARDLDTFSVDRRTVERLLARVPAGYLVVAESGVTGRGDVETLAEAGVDAVLVGTAIARSDDPGGMVKTLVGVRRRAR